MRREGRWEGEGGEEGRERVEVEVCMGIVEEATNLRDPLLMLSPIEHRPCDPTRVLALEEQRFGFAVLEAEDLAVAADEDFALSHLSTTRTRFNIRRGTPSSSQVCWLLRAVVMIVALWVVGDVPFRDRASGH